MVSNISFNGRESLQNIPVKQVEKEVHKFVHETAPIESVKEAVTKKIPADELVEVYKAYTPFGAPTKESAVEKLNESHISEIYTPFGAPTEGGAV